MNAELIRLSRKAAKEWARTDGYNQVSQLLNMLCDELEASSKDEALPLKEKAYRAIASHIFAAHCQYTGGKTLAILADDFREAERLAKTALGSSSVFVKRVVPTGDPQVYEV